MSKFIPAIVVLFIPISSVIGDIIYVNECATGANNGLTWSDAFQSLGDALKVASFGDEIWVATGVYYPTSTSDRSVNFVIPDGLSMYGGFQGGESRRSERDPGRLQCRLSGDIGVAGDRSDNSYQVVVVSGCLQGVFIDGFTIGDANNDLPEEQGRGGGIYVENSRLTLRGCNLTDNYALGGGAIFNLSSTIQAVETRFIRNLNDAVNNYPGTIAFGRCEFRRNTSFGDGGAVRSARGSITKYANCLFRGNKQAADGGACFEQGTSHFVNCLFVKNRATNACGALMVWGGDMTVEGCTFFSQSR